MKRIQDSVHGLMEFRGMEGFAVEALAAPELQRLRRIKQLGLVNLVFPGAEHSRFTHSVGAAHVMSRFANALAGNDYLPASLKPDESLVRDLVLAALCHDLGHGPLSHAWEQQVIRTSVDNDWGGSRDRWRVSLGLGTTPTSPSRPWLDKPQLDWHEMVTQALILAPGGPLNQMLEGLEKGTSERIAALLGGRFVFPYLAQAFASDVDVDRCDFVLRDALQSGVAHGRYDIDWLVSTIAVGETAAGKAVIGFDANKAPRVIEQLLIARRALYDTVYHHRAVRAAEGMTGLLLGHVREWLAQQPEARDQVDGFGPEALNAAISGQPLSASAVLELDDEVLSVFIRRLARLPRKTNPYVIRLAGMLVNRSLFKPIEIDEERLTREAFNDDGAAAKIDRVLEKRGYRPGNRFRFLDEAKFSFFHDPDGDDGTFLIDSDGKASPVRRHDVFKHHNERRLWQRLYVPAEVVDEASKAVAPSSRSKR